LACPSSTAGITSALSDWIFNGELSNITNLNWMRIMDKCLLLLIPFRNISGKAWETIHRFCFQKTDRQFRAAANFGELKLLLTTVVGKTWRWFVYGFILCISLMTKTEIEGKYCHGHSNHELKVNTVILIQIIKHIDALVLRDIHNMNK
jgi:hypothetical protein